MMPIRNALKVENWSIQERGFLTVAGVTFGAHYRVSRVFVLEGVIEVMVR